MTPIDEILDENAKESWVIKNAKLIHVIDKDEEASLNVQLHKKTKAQLATLINDCLESIGNEPMPRIGRSGKYIRSPQSFQDGFEEARAEIRTKLKAKGIEL